MIFITHDVAEAVFLADRVVVLSKGRVLKELDVPTCRARAAGTRSSRTTGSRRSTGQVLQLVRSA